MDEHKMFIEEEFLNVKQAAEFLQISCRSLYRLLEEGRLDFYRPIPRRLLISITCLAAYMESTKNSIK
jgi:excisionase family DNA binding protein